VTVLPSIDERPAYLRFLPNFLFRKDEPPLSYILKGYLLALLPSLALSMLAGLVASPTAEIPDIPVQGSTSLLLLIVVGPLLETLILLPMVLGFRRLFGPGPAVLLCALLWAVGHSLAAAIWGLVVWWPFLLFSIAILTWRDRGLLQTVAVVTTIHGLQNATAGLLLLVQG
jgi:membrane protease YdiL (CAAX protease family)